MSNSTGSTEDIPLVFTSRKVMILISITIVSLMTVSGNMLVFIVFVKNEQLRKPTNYFVVSLAVADFAIGLLSVNFYSVYLLYGYWPLGTSVCDFYLCVDYWLCQSSVLNLVVISVERFIGIKFPVYYRNSWKGKTVLLAIGIVWTISFLVWTALILPFRYKDGERIAAPDTCYIYFLYESWYITIITACIAYYVPVLVMAILYAQLYFTLVKQKQKVTSLQPQDMDKKGLNESSCSKRFSSSSVSDIKVTAVPATHLFESKNDNRTVLQSQSSGIMKKKGISCIEPKKLEQRSSKEIINTRLKIQKLKSLKLTKEVKTLTMLILIISTFAITWFPYNLFAVITPFCADCISSPWRDFGYIFCYINSALNPICYALGNERFRREFRRILRLYKKR